MQQGRVARARFELTPRLIALAGVMIAVVFVATRLIQVPIPGGYVHLGDIAIYFASFTFGPLVGAIAGTLGPTLADLSSGFANYAPGTFVIHGLQGLVAGLIGWRAGLWRMALAGLVGGVILVGGYFVYDFFILRVGTGTAIADVWFNLGQAATGAIISIPLVLAVRKAYPPIETWAARRAWQEETR